MRWLSKADIEKMGLSLHALSIQDVNKLYGLVAEYNEKPSTAQFSIILEFLDEMTARAYDNGYFDATLAES